MRWLVLAVFIAVVASLGGGYLYLKDSPERLYHLWITGQGWNKYYEINKFRPLLLAPTHLAQIPIYQEDYVQLWREFPLRNSLIPLPTRHPLFQTVPIIDFIDKNSHPQIGMTILAAQGRELARIYTFPTSFYPDYSQGQDLFKLPYIRKQLMKKNVDELWHDIFSYRIENKSKTIEAMIYDLYILHLRSKLLPEETIGYGLIKDGKQAMVELASSNKDYRLELVITQNNGSLYSYLLKTEVQNQDSQKLRAKYLNAIGFSPIDEAMGKVLYTEFKLLNFARQVDQEGMLYLLSSWSQNPDNLEILKEMIFYLERGQQTRHLKVLYDYSFKKYGKTFTTKKEVVEQDDPDMALQRKIEIEDHEQQDQAEIDKSRPVLNPNLSPDEKMNLYLKKAKEEKKDEVKDMIIH